MQFRFLSFRTFGTGAVQYDTKAFMSDDVRALNKAVCREVEILLANGHTGVTVHEPCDAKVLTQCNITLYKI